LTAPTITGSITDPEFRRKRARHAAKARTSPAYHIGRVRDLVTSSRAAQGLPPVVTDELTLGQIAELIEGGGGDAPAA
jgi:hypothetical protein